MTGAGILSEEEEPSGARILRTDVTADTIGTFVLTPAGARLEMGNRAAELQIQRARATKERTGGARGKEQSADGASQ